MVRDSARGPWRSLIKRGSDSEAAAIDFSGDGRPKSCSYHRWIAARCGWCDELYSPALARVLAGNTAGLFSAL
jgi:hypothetical protein